MAAVQLIIGLGSPGPEHDRTRHNMEALFVGYLVHIQGVSFVVDRRYFGLVGKFGHQGKNVRLLIPTTYMNHSDRFVAVLAGFLRIASNAILVTHDEFGTPPGTTKLKTGGGHDGYNGLHDIITQLDNQNSFHRLRPSIDHPGHSSLVSGYVLGRAPCSEQELFDTGIDFALGVLSEVFTGDWTRAMQKLHSQKV